MRLTSKLLITIEEGFQMTKKLSPVSPGEILVAEFLEPAHISQNKLARDIDVPVGRVNDIIHGRRAITVDTALRLAIYFGTSPEFWLNLQNRHDLKVAERTVMRELKKEIRPLEKKLA